MSDGAIPADVRMTLDVSAAGRRSFSPEFTWPLFGIALVCWGAFVWASQRGYDFTDDAHYLAWAAYAPSYAVSATQFGYLWHPLYELAGGNIAIFRVLGGIVLVACAGFFAHALVRFIGIAGRGSAAAIAAAVITSCLWVFTQWLPTPNYNTLNLCGMLLFFSGLLLASAPTPVPGEDIFRGTIGPAALSGLAIGVLALAKPTSCVLAVGLGIAWTLLVRPPRATLCLVVAAAAAILTFAVAAVLIDSSIGSFVRRLELAFAFTRSRDSNGDIHGIRDSLVAPFQHGHRWKIPGAVALSLVTAALAVGVARLVTVGRADSIAWRAGAAWLLAAALAIWIAWSRALDFRVPVIPNTFHVWDFAPAVLLAVIAVLVFTAKRRRASPESRTLAFVALMFSAAPFAFAFGSNAELIQAVSGAAVFWLAAAIILCALAQAETGPALLAATLLLFSAATAGMVGGMAIAPGRIGTPIWQQTQRVEIGPRGAHLSVDAETATFIQSLQRGARANGLRPYATIIDMSSSGPGVTFALAGISPGNPWLFQQGPHPMAYIENFLASEPTKRLHDAWIVTDDVHPSPRICQTLSKFGLAFPSRYRIAASAYLDRLQWRQVLWKPVNGGPLAADPVLGCRPKQVP